MSKIFHLLIIAVIAMGVFSCSQKKVDLGLRQTYNEALFDYYEGKIETSKEKLQKIISEHQGTRYAGYAYLILADVNFDVGTAEALKIAEIYYNLFQETNKNSHLIPYAISQVIILNYLLNESKLMVKHTDSSPYKESINQYRKFYFFYPKNAYLEMVRDILERSIEKLALIEEQIGDWYYKQKLYAAAINRYKTILRDYNIYSEAKRVTEKLIVSLDKNNQEQEADEIRSVLNYNGAQ